MSTAPHASAKRCTDTVAFRRSITPSGMRAMGNGCFKQPWLADRSLPTPGVPIQPSQTRPHRWQNRLYPTNIPADAGRVSGAALDSAPGKRGPAPKLQQQMERIQRSPKAQQGLVMQMINAVLAQRDR